MTAFFLWFLIISLLGWMSFPIAYRFFAWLPDRGYSFSRVLGLLIWGYIFWLLGTLGILQNDVGGQTLAMVILLGLSAVSLRNGFFSSTINWVKSNKKLILFGEFLFLMAFALMTMVRAANPDISGTEKPMELAFINAILRSPGFPPHDPWLSGYSISYYYFGYVMTAMLTRFSGISASVGFNLALAAWFAMSGLGGFGLVFNLLQGSRNNSNGVNEVYKNRSLFSAFLGPLFLLLISNLEGFLEMLHARGVFWKQATDGTWQSSFWKWLDILELNRAPSAPFTWTPNRMGGIWWWRASRVLQDYDLSGNSKEIIDEFPFFSFLLGDLHPHVLSIPFVLLGVGVGLNLYFSRNRWLPSGKGLFFSINAWMKNWGFPLQSLTLFKWLRKWEFWLIGMIFGGLAFLNIWDILMGVGLFSAVFTYLRYKEDGWGWRRVFEFIETGIIMGVMAGVIYLPYFLGFSSQAGGFLPSAAYFTRGIHLWVMFAPLFIPTLLWLICEVSREKQPKSLRNGIIFAVALVGGLWALSYTLTSILSVSPAIGSMLEMGTPGRSGQSLSSALISIGNQFYGIQGGSNTQALFWGTLVKRLIQPGAWITLLVFLVLIWSLFSLRIKDGCEIVENQSQTGETFPDSVTTLKFVSSRDFIGLLLLTSITLILVPEFFYLRDQFGWRMNTIFKFYYQAWILLSVAAAYCTAKFLLRRNRSIAQVAVENVLISVFILVFIYYPIFGLATTTNRFKPMEWNLDGAAYLQRYNPDDYAGIEFLKNAPYGVVAEAIGGSYSGFARVATFSGLPNVLGWPGHESQWRGGAAEMGSREGDIERLYRTSNWNEALEILAQYHIRYVFVGSLERSSLRVNEAKFQSRLKTVFQQGQVVIYEVPVEQNPISTIIELKDQVAVHE